ncbi:vascular cell adhesion protein 1-like [Chanodichthys erythropterus]|uniref:vascular cell adhesion protein 1-like n=1 Tax=Chanodichthys erythropterus TaxID=933992 RepID=UPI00351EA310
MLQHFFGLFYLSAVSQLVLFTGTHAAECPLQLNPQRVVVRYNGSVAVNCSTNVPHDGIGWEAIEGLVPMSLSVSLITWRVSNLREWDTEPFCFINPKGGDQCASYLAVTVYKTPDSVSISTVNHIGPMKEGNQYELQCDVLNVAPVQYLTVKWYKGETLVDQTTFTDTIKTPVNKTATLMIRPDRSDDGVQYRCEAELDLGEEGPQPSPKDTSDPLSVEVNGTHAAECPVELNPQRAVVRYGSPVSVTCSTSVPHDGIGWEASEGAVPMSKDNLITWRVSNLREWYIKPFCFINPKGGEQCSSYLPITIYKTPDSVSISTVNHIGPMKEGNQYELQCDVLNVAPVQNLTVKWYKGETLVDQTTFTDTIKTPVDKTVTLMIRPDRSDDGVQYRCEAEQDLGEEGPQPPSKVTSKPLSVEVNGCLSKGG